MAIRECGRIIEIKDGSMVVLINPPSMCEGCTSCAGTQRKERRVTLEAQPDMREGDEVWIESQPGDMLKAVALVFFMPTVGMFAAIAAAAYLFSSHSEPVYFLCGIAGAILSLVAAKFLVDRYIPFHRTVIRKS